MDLPEPASLPSPPRYVLARLSSHGVVDWTSRVFDWIALTVLPFCLACSQLATDSGFPFVKRLSADSLVAQSEHGKAHAIVAAFENAYKSDASVIILDDIEQIMGARARVV